MDRVEREGKVRGRSLFFGALVAFLFSAFAFQLWYHAVRTSPTIDEPTHVLAGHMHWRCGDFGINPEHPPLTKLLATVSLNTRDNLAEPPWPCGERYITHAEDFVGGAKFLIDNGIDDVLIPARLLSATLSLLLAAVVFIVSFRMFGHWEAIVALAILAFEPTMIAHGSLVTTDMALTLTALATTYALYRYAKQPTWLNFLITGVAFGLMLAAKHSALVFLPLLFVVFVADAFLFRADSSVISQNVLRRVAAFFVFCVIGVVLLWSLYGFHSSALPNATIPEISAANHISSTAGPSVARSYSAAFVAALDRSHIFPDSYVLGLADVVASSNRNMTIFGRNYASGKWFYFPIAFLVKSSIALLFMLPFGLLLPIFAAERRRELMFLLAPPIFYFAFSLTSGINIGVRHILPVYAFFAIVAAAGVVWMSRRFTYFRYAIILLLLFHAVTAVRTAPNYIAFSNDLWGGTSNTYKIFPVDSNLDWGQNEKFVAEYLQRENIHDCWYAGWGNLELMNALVPCRQMPNTFPRAAVPLADPLPTVIEGTVLVNAANLPPKGGNEYVPMTLQQPVARIGGSIFVYQGRFEIKLASALSYAQRANELARLGRVDEAIRDARQSVELADYDPRTHLALGRALLLGGNNSEAISEFTVVIETARANLQLFRNEDARARYELKRLGVEPGNR